MTRQQLLQFFAERPAISPRQFGIQMKYSEGRYLIDFLKKGGDNLPPSMEKKIKPLLKLYGYQGK